MRAAVLIRPGQIEVKDIQDPQVSPNEVLIRVRATGICGTDMAIYEGRLKVGLPHIPGHEFSGEIAETGDKVTNLKYGDRVVSEINITCGKCWFCTRGLRTHCLHRAAIGIDLPGSFAEYVKVPATNVHRIPDIISFEDAVFVEPLAACLRLVELSPIPPDGTVIVLGPGPIGLLCLQLAKLHGANVIVIGTRWSRLNIAKILGADAVVNINEEDPVARVKELTDGRGGDMVIEATGNPLGFELALKLVRACGVIAVKSTHGLPVSFDLTKAVVNEVKIQGSRCGPFNPAIRLLATKRIRVSELVTHTIPLEHIAEAFMLIKSRQALKVILYP